jgi:hypothetical protein
VVLSLEVLDAKLPGPARVRKLYLPLGAPHFRSRLAYRLAYAARAKRRMIERAEGRESCAEGSAASPRGFLSTVFTHPL